MKFEYLEVDLRTGARRVIEVNDPDMPEDEPLTSIIDAICARDGCERIVTYIGPPHEDDPREVAVILEKAHWAVVVEAADADAPETTDQ